MKQKEDYFQVEKLTKEEEREIQLYTSECVCNGERINKARRMGIHLTEEQNKRFQNVQAIIGKSVLLEQIVLYRAVSWEKIHDRKICKGTVLFDAGILEASFDENIISFFTHKDTLLIIDVPQGKECLYDTPYNARTDEQGVLFKADSKLLVTKVKKQNIFNKINYIYCRMID